MKKQWSEKTDTELARMAKGLGKDKGRIQVQGLTEKEVQRRAKAELVARNAKEKR